MCHCKPHLVFFNLFVNMHHINEFLRGFFIVENEPPFIDGDEVIHVEVNRTARIRFNASDDKGFTYQILEQPNIGFTFDNETGVALWTPVDTNATSIRYILSSLMCIN